MRCSLTMSYRCCCEALIREATAESTTRAPGMSVSISLIHVDIGMLLPLASSVAQVCSRSSSMFDQAA